MILVIDNYDSFVHNLARYIERLGGETQVVRNDQITLPQVEQLAPQAIVLSPGPCTPDQAGCSMALVERFGPTVPMLGVCLGHQAMAQALGGRVVRADKPMHGQASRLRHAGQSVFAGLPESFDVGRYHSLVVDPESLPAELEPIAWTDGPGSSDETLMAFAHREWPMVGVQFHPESILTEQGYPLLANFLQLAGVRVRADLAELAASERWTEPSPYTPPDRPVTF